MSPLLPVLCFAVHPESKQPVLIVRGVDGYYPVILSDGDPAPEGASRTFVNSMNQRLGLEPHVITAMINGSMLGWDQPVADPEIVRTHLSELTIEDQNGSYSHEDGQQ